MSCNHSLFLAFADKSTYQDEYDVEKLLNGGTVSKNLKEFMVYEKVEISSLYYWNVLLSRGYFTIANTIYNYDDIYDLKIPNNHAKNLIGRFCCDIT